MPRIKKSTNQFKVMIFAFEISLYFELQGIKLLCQSLIFLEFHWEKGKFSILHVYLTEVHWFQSRKKSYTILFSKLNYNFTNFIEKKENFQFCILVYLIEVHWFKSFASILTHKVELLNCKKGLLIMQSVAMHGWK